MITKFFAVYDHAAKAYMQPFQMQTRGQAIRGWIDAVNDPKTQFSKHPQDFVLYEIASYDDESGSFENTNPPQPLGTALEHKVDINS